MRGDPHVGTIPASWGTSELSSTFSEFHNSESIRAVKVVIEDETLVAKDVVNASGDWREDFDGAITPLLEEKKPCYLLYRLDSRNASGFDFVFIAWSPDFANVKEKMLYASTKATFKQTFGTRYIKEELYATEPKDTTLEAYDRHLVSEAAPPPLTEEEIEKAEIRQAETGANIGVSTKRQVATGVSFPLDADAMAAVNDFKADKKTYVQLRLDLDAEQIKLAKADKSSIDDIAAQVPEDAARYHLFNFKHSHEGDNMESAVFVYSCPGYKCSVKERMMYSTCKGPLIDTLEDEVGIQLAKKLEISEGSEFTQEWLYDTLHPKQVVFKQKFKKPARPGKGGRRLIRDRK
ncbi:hypothetical protein PTSG_02449 [Salpingoeca rosetta]|uniref:Twinfilin n=1 Tax=Salpingoeca rosetta (strain ATCC 50818 / BSB-021) TaxID=946362 RepID=F2U285_SALR5|nr:uncharacterized protein PTSG_02449 [Salpingoeca rosetta]EGD81737.1 hypothetical protein PTSG_02449 [Salpingoeca rosetta]|eukprot:XP_004996941.1 hypothetical protein PTSG_02449 [Salpingoeca rosetta]